MQTIPPAQVVSTHASGVFFISVRDNKDDLHLGSAFHIGDGYLATARHVIEGMTIESVGRNDTSMFRTIGGSVTVHPKIREDKIEGPFFHPNKLVDVAIIKIPGHIAPAIQLSAEVDVEMESELLMREVVVMGYPRIPNSLGIQLVVFRGEISATVQSWADNERHFIVSGMARGGFSGAPIVGTRFPNLALGIITDAAVKGDQAAELGFIYVTSPKAIFETVDYHRLPIQPVQHSYRGVISPYAPRPRFL